MQKMSWPATKNICYRGG